MPFAVCVQGTADKLHDHADNIKGTVKDAAKDVQFGIGDGSERSKRALWYRKGVCPAPEYRQRKTRTTMGES